MVHNFLLFISESEIRNIYHFPSVDTELYLILFLEIPIIQVEHSSIAQWSRNIFLEADFSLPFCVKLLMNNVRKILFPNVLFLVFV